MKSLSSSFSLSVEEEYNDNIYQDSNASQSPDFITRIRLGMAASLSGPMLNIKLSYQPEQILFSRNTDKNDLRHEFNASLNIGADKGITLIRNLVFLDLSDTINREAFYSRREAKKEDYAIDQTTTNELKIHPYIKKNLTRTNSLECGYEYTNTAYSDSDATDRQSYGGSLIWNKIFSRKLEGNISYSLTRELAQRTDFHDYSRQEVGLGLSDQIAPSVKLVGAGGYDWLAFASKGSKSSVDSQNSADSKDNVDNLDSLDSVDSVDSLNKLEGAFWSIDLNGALPLMKTPTIFYRYETSYQNSIDGGVLSLRRHNLGWDYQRRIHITWTMFRQKEDYQELDWVDESSGIDFSLTVPVNRMLDFTLAGEWVKSDYEPDGETVRYYSADTGIRWRLSHYFLLCGRIPVLRK